MHAGCGQAGLLMQSAPAPVLLPVCSLLEGACYTGACEAVTA